MAQTPRKYDLVLFGASGYTGRLTAEHIALTTPTKLRWALAGRSEKKLRALAEECKKLNPDRVQPEIELCNTNGSELSALAQKTRLLISTVGPYALYGEAAFKACAANGTHYLDVTGEVPWVARMIKKYETTAKVNGSIMIPQIGFESAPADMLTFALVSYIRETLGVPTKEVTLSLHEFSASPSGGTSLTALNITETFSIREIAEAQAPYALSPIPGPKRNSTLPLVTKLLGLYTVPDLGTLTSSIAALPDRPVVHRSWGLLGGPKTYGPHFHFHEFMRARNALTAVLCHFGLALLGILVTLSPFRWLARKFIYKPGEGPSRESTRKDHCEYRAIGIPDFEETSAEDTPPETTGFHMNKQKRAYLNARFDGGIYYFTGILLTNAAMTILSDDECEAKKLGGGILTPATLGHAFVDRLKKDGFRIELKVLDD